MCSRLASQGNTLTLIWAPSHSGIENNEVADDWAKMAAESPPVAIPRDYLRETSFTHTTRRATEARSEGMAKWIGDHVKSKHCYTPPKGPKLRKELRHERKTLAGRYYQLTSGHAATGGYLCNKVHKLPPNKCWWCGHDVRQTRHHLFVNCAAWKPQIKELWKDVGYLCGWKHPRVPRISLLFGDKRAIKMVLSFLRMMKVGQMATIPPRDGAREEGGEESFGEMSFGDRIGGDAKGG